MARSDLLLQLVQSGTRGDKTLFLKAVEAIISEERMKQHHAVADRLQETLNESRSKNGTSHQLINRSENRIDTLLLQAVPERRLTDLVLDERIKQICLDVIQEQNRVDLLRSYNLEPRSKIMVVGPPGNGKTSVAEAIASELMIPFFSVRYESIIASYLGETSVRLKALFDYVRTTRCVLFFDEFDAIGKERGDNHETGEIKRVVSSLLLQIDQLPSYVIVIAATNHPELLDKAVWRRFQVKVALERPTQKKIESFLQKFEESFKVSFGLSATHLAKCLKGLSFSEIKDFCEDIVRTAVLSPPGMEESVRGITRQKLDELKLSYKPKPKR